MLVTCPRCETTFSLPDELFKPGKKARCSNCRCVFPMYVQPAVPAGPEELPPLSPPDAAPESRSGKKRAVSAVYALGAAVLLVLLGYGGYLAYGVFFPASGNAPPESASGPVDGARADYERRINSIALEDIRQFHVDNVVEGRLLVIEGLAVNRSGSDKDYIAVEASLLDADNTVLTKTEQLCGAPLTLFQLQSLGKEELKEALNSRVTILTNNTNVPPGGMTPFVIVFSTPPQGVRTFEVRVIEARDSHRRQDG